MTDAFSLDGRTSLVIGSSRGIGWGIARALANAGSHVVINGRDCKRVETRRDALLKIGCLASTACFDANDLDIATAAIRDLDELDILVVNAAHALRGSSLDFSREDWDAVMAMGLRTPFMLAQAALRRMVPQGRGRIILLSSIFDRIARPQVAAYVSSKGGVSALARALAVEFGHSGVTVNAIAPGYVRTNATQAMHDDHEFSANVRRRTPIGRWAEPEDIGGAAVFLASDAAAYVNGTVLTVDGGLSAAL